MHPFHQKPRPLQWLLALLLALPAGAAVVYWVEHSTMQGYYWALWFLLIPLVQFCCTPLLTLLGVYRYLSPMVLVYMPRRTKQELHLGTSWDYAWVMRKVPAGYLTRRYLLLSLLEGLLALAQQVERGHLPPEVVITGTSYFFSRQTAERLGFQVQPAGAEQKLNLVLNLLDLCWQYSRSQGQWTWPNIGRVKVATTTGAELLKHKAALHRLHEALLRRER